MTDTAIRPRRVERMVRACVVCWVDEQVTPDGRITEVPATALRSEHSTHALAPGSRIRSRRFWSRVARGRLAASRGPRKH